MISADGVTSILNSTKVAFTNLIKIYQFILTLPVSSTSAERSFSTMKRVKTYFRSTMSDKRLDLHLLSIERSLRQELLECPKDCIDYFAIIKNRRLLLK